MYYITDLFLLKMFITNLFSFVIISCIFCTKKYYSVSRRTKVSVARNTLVQAAVLFACLFVF